MESNEISPFVTLKKVRDGETIEMEQKFIKVRTSSNKIMAVHYKAPMERTIELEMFFENFNSIERLYFDIGGTGDIGVSFRGLIDGKDSSLPEDYDYKILMLEEHKCPSKVEIKNIKRSSKFRPNFTLAK